MGNTTSGTGIASLNRAAVEEPYYPPGSHLPALSYSSLNRLVVNDYKKPPFFGLYLLALSLRQSKPLDSEDRERVGLALTT